MKKEKSSPDHVLKSRGVAMYYRELGNPVEKPGARRRGLSINLVTSDN